MSTPTTEEEVQPLPALFEHACNVYQLMESEAKLISREGGGSDDQQLIWEGHLTKLFQRLHLSVPYYTSVTRELKRMGCIKQMRRGGGNSLSQWLVLQAPTEELFRDDINRTQNATARRKTKLEAHDAMLLEHGRIIQRIMEDYDTIIQILQERESTSA